MPAKWRIRVKARVMLSLWRSKNQGSGYMGEFDVLGGVLSRKVFASPSTTDLSLVPRTHEKKPGPLMCREAETGRHLGDWLASRSSLVREFWASERHCVKRVS